MTAPVAGAAVKAVANAAANSDPPKGGKVSRARMQEIRRERREAAKAEAASPAPAEQKPAPSTPKKRAQPATPATQPSKTPTLPAVSVPQPVSSGAGFILALMFWTWVALPFLKDGPTGIRKQLKAKFTNKAPDGSWLP